MKKLWTYFKFNRTEQNGFFVILLIIILFSIVYSLVRRADKKDPIAHQVRVFEQSFHDSRGFVDYQNKKFSANNVDLEKEVAVVERNAKSDDGGIKPFYFDPNNLSPDDCRKLDLSDKQIVVIKN